MDLVSSWRRLVAFVLRLRCAAGEDGASLVEYTLVLLLVVLAAMVALQFIGGTTAHSLNDSGQSLFNP